MVKDELKERSLGPLRSCDWEMGRRPGGEDENEIRRVLVKKKKEGRRRRRRILLKEEGEGGLNGMLGDRKTEPALRCQLNPQIHST